MTELPPNIASRLDEARSDMLEAEEEAKAKRKTFERLASAVGAMFEADRDPEELSRAASEVISLYWTLNGEEVVRPIDPDLLKDR